MTTKLKTLIAIIFSAFFLILSISLAGLAAYQFLSSFFIGGFSEDEIVTGIIRPLNTAIIALATFELGIGISKEYATHEDGDNVYSAIRRTITRFVGVVCIALVLEGLIMVIKYSQLELAGNLYYPVAVLIGASVLLIALGGFLKLTSKESE